METKASVGSGGRPMVAYSWDLYNWTAHNHSDSPSVELDLLMVASGEGALGSLVLPATIRSATSRMTWKFNVTATNWLGNIGWNTFEVRDFQNVMRCGAHSEHHLSIAATISRNYL